MTPTGSSAGCRIAWAFEQLVNFCCKTQPTNRHAPSVIGRKEMQFLRTSVTVIGQEGMLMTRGWLPWASLLESGVDRLSCAFRPSFCTSMDYRVNSRHFSSSSVHRSGRVDRKWEGAVTSRVQQLLKGVSEGDRASLAEAITLVESSHPVKHKQAQWLLSQVLARRNQECASDRLRPTIRVGLSGPPGAGKSTLIERLGLHLLAVGYRVAVLAVDPTSVRTGGSILGDKTRMTRLAHEHGAYIRPSPTSGSLGGVTRSTNEAIMLCEGAGYDVVLVETVGVGQSETAVSNMVDVFVLVIPPAAGDELQGIKRGIVEVSDVIVVNKADGDLLPAARRIMGDYVSAVKLSRSKSKHWKTQVLMASAQENEGVVELWDTLEQCIGTMKEVTEFETKRQMQQRLWMWTHIDGELGRRFRSDPALANQIKKMEEEVLAGTAAPGTAADILVDTFLNISTS